MSLSTQRKQQIFHTAVSGWFVILLLLVYLVGSVEFNSIHSLFHASENSDLHSAENEKEACHKAIYHNSKEGCDHRIHLTANEKCPLCHLIGHADQLLADEIITVAQVYNTNSNEDLYQFESPHFSDLLPARAPPAC